MNTQQTALVREKWFKGFTKLLTDSNSQPYSEIFVAGRDTYSKRYYYGVKFRFSAAKVLFWPETFFSSNWLKTKDQILDVIGSKIAIDTKGCPDVELIEKSLLSKNILIFPKVICSGLANDRFLN